jgi:Flp pilus assembly protein TadB
VTIIVLIGARLPIDDDPTVPLQLAEAEEPPFTAYRLKRRHETRIEVVFAVIVVLCLVMALLISADLLTLTVIVVAVSVAVITILAGIVTGMMDRRRYRRQKTTL